MAAEMGNKYALENEGGAPTKYREEFAEQAYKLCLLGYTDKDLAFFFGVSEATINNWKQEHKEFLESLSAGKAIADANVAHSFYKRANGYEYTEVTFEKIDSKAALEITTDGDLTSNQAYKKKVVTKHLPADPGAALSWLKNRQRDLWKDKQSLEVGFESLTDPQLDQILKALNIHL